LCAGIRQEQFPIVEFMVIDKGFAEMVVIGKGIVKLGSWELC